MSNPIEVVLRFEEHINARNAEAICALMGPDGEFVDALGNRIQGLAKLHAAWEGYFKIVPDYSISHSEIFADGNTVAVFGSAQGTFVNPKGGAPKKENFWKTPAAWRAVVKDGKIAVWQVYADNEPIRALMRKSS
ncbi:MAG TPA: nuclear transport factor 2 family protein [Candidatus Angelobacter sp.]|jgi:ketosteroid isomerase-like protein